MPRVRRELLDAADELARRDRRLRRVIKDTGPPDLRRGRPRAEHFAELARAVSYQQLAGAAARAIHGRFQALFADNRPTPEAVLALPVAKLRAAGLSGTKAATIRDLPPRVGPRAIPLPRAPPPPPPHT